MIYMKGVKKAELEHITDFLQNGEAFISQEDIKSFLEAAQELQVKGLQGDIEGIGQNKYEQNKLYNDEELDYSFKSNRDIDGQESTLHALEQLADPDVTLDGTFDTLDESKIATNDSHELNIQLD